MVGNQWLGRGSFFERNGKAGRAERAGKTSGTSGTSETSETSGTDGTGETSETGETSGTGEMGEQKKLPLVRQLNFLLYTNYLIIHHLHQSNLKTL